MASAATATIPTNVPRQLHTCEVVGHGFGPMSQTHTGEGRDPDPSAGLMDSQSVKGADTVGVDSRGHDAGKKTSDAKDCQAATGRGRGAGMGKGGLWRKC